MSSSCAFVNSEQSTHPSFPSSYKSATIVQGMVDHTTYMYIGTTAKCTVLLVELNYVHAVYYQFTVKTLVANKSYCVSHLHHLVRYRSCTSSPLPWTSLLFSVLSRSSAFFL